MNAGLPPPCELVPHAGAMVLLDSIESVGEQRLAAQVVVRGGALLGDDVDTVPALVGIEYMAQAVAAWSGWHARSTGDSVRLGFLLGTRRFTSNVDTFRCGARLHVAVEQQLRDDNGMAVFSGSISGDGVEQSASLSVFQPPDTQAYLAELQS